MGCDNFPVVSCSDQDARGPHLLVRHGLRKSERIILAGTHPREGWKVLSIQSHSPIQHERPSAWACGSYPVQPVLKLAPFQRLTSTPTQLTIPTNRSALPHNSAPEVAIACVGVARLHVSPVRPICPVRTSSHTAVDQRPG
jgi:hypothetical protein